MGYPTYFWTSDDAAPACVEFCNKDYGDFGFLEAGMFRVPILWSMCFSSADVNVEIEADCDDGDQPGFGMSCDTTRERAVANLERRMASLLRIAPADTHEAAQLFIERLRHSAEPFVHLELSVQVAEERAPEAESWRTYWGGLLDGLDAPVSTVRTGLSRFVLGTGLPSGWKALCRYADGHSTLNPFMRFNLTAHQVAGAEVSGLRRWQA